LVIANEVADIFFVFISFGAFLFMAGPLFGVTTKSLLLLLMKKNINKKKSMMDCLFLNIK
jgi:hypothetical protein